MSDRTAELSDRVNLMLQKSLTSRYLIEFVDETGEHRFGLRFLDPTKFDENWGIVLGEVLADLSRLPGAETVFRNHGLVAEHYTQSKLETKEEEKQ